MGITRQSRFTRQHRCPICDGCDEDPRGKGKRCMGFLGSDGKYAHCSREDLAGDLPLEDTSQTFAHRLEGPCKCGHQHGGSAAWTPPSPQARRIEASYAYTDAEGTLLFEVVRYSPKGFGQRHLNGTGWKWGRGVAPRVLYRLAELVNDDGDRPVYIVEGEKDVDTLARRGFLATCNPEGAGKWHFVAAQAQDVLAGRDVVIIADRDSEEKKFAGQRHALQVATSLEGHARSVALTMCPKVKDVTDLYANGGDVSQLVAFEPPPEDGSVAGFAASFEQPELEQGAPADEEPPPPPRWDSLVTAVPAPWFVEKPPPRTWLLRDGRSNSEGVLPVGTVGMFVAEGGAGKTMALCQLAIAIATGTPWLGCLDVVQQGRVLLCLGEEDHEEARRRLYRARRCSNTRIPDEGSIVTLPLRGEACGLLKRDAEGNQARTAFGSWLLDYVARAGPWALVVIDPLSRFAGPDAETENSVGTLFVTELESLAACGPTVLCAHHTNKVSRGPQGTVSMASSRGASSITDGARWGATLASERVVHGSAELNDRLGNIVTLSFGKSNVSRTGEPILLRHDRDNGGAFLPLDEVDLSLVSEARKPSRSARSVQQEAERALAEHQRESSIVVRQARTESARRSRDAEDDTVARQLRLSYPEASERELIAHIKRVRTCGSERAQDAVQRTRGHHEVGT